MTEIETQYKVMILMAVSEEKPEVIGVFSTRKIAVEEAKKELAKYSEKTDHMGWTYSTDDVPRDQPDIVSLYDEIGDFASDIYAQIVPVKKPKVEGKPKYNIALGTWEIGGKYIRSATEEEMKRQDALANYGEEKNG